MKPTLRVRLSLSESPFVLNDFLLVFPEAVLAIGTVFLLAIGTVRGDDAAAQNCYLGAAILLLSVGAMAISVVFVDGDLASSLQSDAFAVYLKTLFAALTTLALLISPAWFNAENHHRFEYAPVFLSATLGLMVMVSSATLAGVFLGVTLQGSAFAILIAIQNKSLRATETGLRFAVHAGFATAILLYGASLVFGLSGSLGFEDVSTHLASNSLTVGLAFGIALVFAGLFVFAAIVPFNAWVQDAYLAAPAPVTTILATATKIAAIAVLARMIIVSLPSAASMWQPMISALAVITMAMGFLAAFAQTNLIRAMAMASIGHGGFALIGLASGSEAGAKGLLVYLTLYAFAIMGVFACLSSLRSDGDHYLEIDDLEGLGTTKPFMAFLVTALFLSLAGLPPLGGFFGGLYVLLSAVEAELYLLAAAGLIGSIAATAFYVRLIWLVYTREPEREYDAMTIGVKFVFGATASLSIGFALYPTPLVSAAQRAAASLF